MKILYLTLVLLGNSFQKYGIIQFYIDKLMKYGRCINLKLLALTTILLFFATSGLKAKHIIGGEITYKFLRFNNDTSEVTYRITVYIYRDCFGGGAKFDKVFDFGLYSWDNTSSVWEYFDVPGIHEVRLSDVEYLVPRVDSCAIVPRNVCVEKGTYEFQITVPIRKTPYMIAYQRCCRNESITNIPTPGRWGAAYTVEISAEAQRLGNSSPVFKGFPPLVICKDFGLDFDHSATDIEGDQLIYELCSPLHAGGTRDVRGGRCVHGANPPTCDCVRPFPDECVPPFTKVPFKIAYSPQYPLGGNPKVRINPITGRITGTPGLSGQFVVGVCVKEYRNGVLLSKIRRDFQFNVTDCEPTVVASIENDGVIDRKTVKIDVCGENTVDFKNKSYLRNYIYNYKWYFDLKGQTKTFNTWDASVVFPDTGTYKGKLILNQGLKCVDSSNIVVHIYPKIKAAFSFDYDTCSPTPVQFTDQSVTGSGKLTGWQWDFGDKKGNSNKQNPSYQYENPGKHKVFFRVVDKNDCTDILEKEVNWYPAPAVIIVDPSKFEGCAPGDIFFENLSFPIDSTYLVEWDFGDGEKTKGISPNHIYKEPGKYSVKIRITSPIGCTVEDYYENWIKIQEGPEADFDYDPKKLSNFKTSTTFDNLSDRAVSWQWVFDDKDVFYVKDLSYTFKDTGVHKIMLVAFHANGCTDTLIKYIDVVPTDKFVMPNAFTPNGDGTNDYFIGKGYEAGITSFQMEIWDRWGAKVFETRDISKGWDGTLNNSGKSMPGGVYLYIVRYRSSRGKNHVLKGYATLVR